MKFIIKSNAKIPGFGGIRGPILTPQLIPAKKVLDMVSKGCAVYEVMDDGSHRKVEFSDSRVFNQMMKEKQPVVPTVTTEIKIEEKLKTIEEKNPFKNCKPLTEKEIEDIGIEPKTKEIKEDKISKKDKKNSKSDNKSNLPLVDTLEKISDDK